MAIARTAGRPGFSWADLVVGAGVLAVLAAIIAWATHNPHSLSSHNGSISLAYGRLPYYALLSWLRMAAAYVLSLGFALVYAYLAAFNKQAEKVLIPILDVLQSIPILSFLPIVLVAFIALFPHSSLGPNLAAVVLIFTSQAWNLVFALYNGFITIPRDLIETAQSLGLTPWQRFRTLELPHAMGGLVWNTMLSWAGGWFFLMAAEMFSLGSKNYQLAGLGSYLQTAANHANWGAEWMGLATLVAVIVLMDQLVFRPILAWADKFKMEQLVEDSVPPRSAVLMMARRSVLLGSLQTQVWSPFLEWSDQVTRPRPAAKPNVTLQSLLSLLRMLLLALFVFTLFSALTDGAHLLSRSLGSVGLVALATGTTFLRVVVSLALSAVWTVPVGVMIGLDRRLAAKFTPIIQIFASIPATALFPGVVALLLNVSGGLNVAAILLMMLGTQWYVLFNVIAGASAIPEDLKEATRLFRLNRWTTWRTLILPAIFPYLITGLITASGGAWNASIVAEYVPFHGHVYHVFGVGWLISESSYGGHFALLLLSTLMMALVVVAANRLFWRPLYREASERYSLH